jgi:hypothetical protein
MDQVTVHIAGTLAWPCLRTSSNGRRTAVETKCLRLSMCFIAVLSWALIRLFAPEMSTSFYIALLFFRTKLYFESFLFSFLGCMHVQNNGIKVPILVRVWLVSPPRGACVGSQARRYIYIIGQSSACDTPHTDEFDSLEPEPIRTR